MLGDAIGLRHAGRSGARRFVMPQRWTPDSPCGVARLSQGFLIDSQVNELWAETLPTGKKRLRLDQNKTLG